MIYGKVGMNGGYVAEIQRLLNDNGASVTVDGVFGSETLTAVKNFQRSKGLAVDGVVGEQTWSALHGGQPSEAGGSYAGGSMLDKIFAGALLLFVYKIVKKVF